MRRYEVVFVLAPTLTEEQVKGQIETYTTVAKDLGANVLDVDDWGKRRLAIGLFEKFPMIWKNQLYRIILIWLIFLK